MDAEKPFEFRKALQIDLARVLHGDSLPSYHPPGCRRHSDLSIAVSDVVDKKAGALTIMNVATEVINQHGRQSSGSGAGSVVIRNEGIMNS